MKLLVDSAARYKKNTGRKQEKIQILKTLRDL